ncbi:MULTISPECIES: hypothetical protein [unclassified Crossiella]|uniref:hypothetical protein n=1 Tax=unclassified Crossiella TaxID=2620835 RepID=UPI001FFED0F9|nr:MULTISPECIES: hypothetical protein [unclassified Crossiella]MCK2238878.1 hypothetical protein [Crossiella sp. S99.2]MCK2251552.1 hypothetical protein [Crossiella sp. S99.1]
MGTSETTPPGYNQAELAEHLGLRAWQVAVGREFGLIPAPDLDPRWSATTAAALTGEADRIRAAVGAEYPIGGQRAAGRLAVLSGLDVTPADVAALAEQGLLTVAARYTSNDRSHDLFAPAQLDRVAAEQAAALAAVVAERIAWIVAGLSIADAATALGWQRQDQFLEFAQRRGLLQKHGHYARTDLEALVAEGG